MKVVHISTDSGICSSRIIEAIRKQGCQIKEILSKGNESSNVSIITEKYPWSNHWFLRKIQVILNRIGVWPRFVFYRKRVNKARRKYDPFCFTLPITPYKNLVNHPWIKESDIIHLHWVGDFLDYPSFFKNIKKPIVWTLHDINPLMGGFHIEQKLIEATPEFKQLEKELHNIKIKALKHKPNLNVIAISGLMKEKIIRSKTLGSFPVTIVNNGVNPEHFPVYDRLLLRKEFNLKDDKVFLFVANSLNDTNKGLSELLSALEQINMPSIKLICIGNYSQVPRTDISIECVGYVSTPEELAKYYTVADYFVMPSHQESFGLTAIEAAVCGTPIIAYPTGIIPELITESNGIICKDFSVESLITGITMAVNTVYVRNEIRNDVIKRYSINVTARNYINLYKKILQQS